jgi:16S rRNA (adenine1518-N6/adenine1519-N6)-dimethyltransferase
LGQNFVVDPGTVRRVVKAALLVDYAGAAPRVVEVGPGLGSLTLALLEAGASVCAVEIDPVLAAALGGTVAERAPEAMDRLDVVQADALKVGQLPGLPPQYLVANLPYNVAVPVVLTFLERFPTIDRALVMVQAEVAARLVAAPGSRTYGVPSAKLAWWAGARLAGSVPQAAFFPVPRVDSSLVAVDRRPHPETTAPRQAVFRVIDAAFAQRRKTLRAALAALAGGPDMAEQALRAAGVDPGLRGEALSVAEFARIAEALA